MSLSSFTGLNSLDLFFLVIFLLFIGLGAWKGLVRTLFQTASWIAGAAGAYAGALFLSPWLQANIQGLPVFGLQALSGFAGFLLCFLTLRIVGSVVHRLVHKSFLGSLNRWGGALLGAIKATILAVLLLLLMQILPLQGDLLQLRETSFTYQGFAHLSTQYIHLGTLF